MAREVEQTAIMVRPFGDRYEVTRRGRPLGVFDTETEAVKFAEQYQAKLDPRPRIVKP